MAFFSPQPGNGQGNEGAAHNEPKQSRTSEKLIALANSSASKMMFEGLSDGLVILDTEGQVVSGTPHAQSMPAQLLVGRKLIDAVPAGERETLRHALRIVAETQQTTAFDLRLSLDVHAYRWFTCRIGPLLVDGILEGFVIAAIDATHQKQIESALEETRRAQTTLLGNLPGMAYRCENDRDWTMRFVSSGCMALTGYTPEEIVNNRRVKYADMIATEDRGHVWNEVQRALQLGQPFRITYRIRTAGGDLKWVWEQGIGVSTADGSIAAIEGFITDFSEQRFAHEALHAAHRDLEARVLERTHELTDANKNLQNVLDERKRLSWLLKAIVDNVPIMLFVKNAETLAVELWNDAASALTGIPANEIVGKTGYEVFPREQMEAFHERDRAVIRFRKLIAAEEVLTTTHGERLLYTRKIPMFDEKGEPRYLLGISEDITDRKLAMLAAEERTTLSTLAAAVAAVITSGIADIPLLHECTRIIAQCLNVALVRIWTVDPAKRQLQLQASAGEVGTADDDFAVLSFNSGNIGAVAATHKAFATNTPDASTPAAYGWILSGTLAAFAVFPLKVDDRILGVLAIYSRRALSEPTTKALAALADNIASGMQARRSEAALRQSLERFDLMVEGAKVGLWDAMVVASDPYNAANPIYYSPRFKEMLGFENEDFPDVIGSWAERLHPEDAARVFQALDDHLFRRIPFDIEYRMSNRNGVVRWFAARGQAQWDSAGRPVRMSGSFSDITDRKESEQQLLEAREAAEAANRAKSRFLANISHEIRTPIAAMLNATELLTQADTADRAKRVDLILRNTRHLMALIDDLLNFSRLEAGKLEVSRIPCSLLEILADIRAVTAPLANKPHVEFHFEIGTDLPEIIQTDPMRLRQAVINLVSNALKFTDTGFVAVRVSVAPQSPEPRLTIEVTDSGIGIPAPELARVFEAFERVSNPGARVESGVGLGLTISRWIAGQLGGDLSVQSEPGRGSTFTLRVATGPLLAVRWLPAEQWSSAPRTSLGIAPRILPGQLNGHILLAEDYADTREVLKYALSAAGAQVTAVENGLEAVEAAVSDYYDLILMDIRMPQMDGLEATVELRKRGILTPIIALTASTASSDRERIIDAGFDDFWTKPISIESLIQGASAYLAGGSPDEPPAGPDVVTTPTMRSKLERLAGEFIAILPDRMRAIRDLIKADKPREAADRIHQLIGTAGVHGLDEVSNEAARLQRRFRETQTLSLENLAVLEQAIAALSPDSLSSNPAKLQ